VSTPITDVAEPYGNIVYLGARRRNFSSGVAAALAAGPEERARRVDSMRRVLAEHRGMSL